VALGHCSLTRANENIHIAVEQRDVVQQAFAGEAAELVVFQFGDMRLGDAEFAGGCGLGHPFGFDEFIEAHSELDAKLAFVGIGQPQVNEHIA
jgi:hypothetical protein